LIGKHQQLLLAIVNALQQQVDAIDLDFLDLRSDPCRHPLAKCGGILFQPADLGLESRHASGQLGEPGTKCLLQLVEHAFLIADLALGGHTRS